ncbi:MAG: ABC transporter substrate-binding protein [Candidatus Bipolaricaulaceae bacterium]
MRKVAVFVLALGMGAFAWAQEPIKIGALLEFTGACAAYGQMARDALEFAREVGLVPTAVLGRPIELVYFDARTDPVEAANGATRLIQVEKVVAIIGTMCSGVYLGAAEIVQAAGVPMIGPTTTNPLTTQVGDFCFRACFKDDDQGPVAAALARDFFGAETAAVVIDVAQAYCVGLGKFFIEAFEALGGKVVATLYCRSGDVDYTAQLTEIQRVNPDIIYTPNYYTEVALMAKQARALGLTQPILGADGLFAPELIEIGGAAVEGIHFTTFWHPAKATGIGLRYAEEYKKYFGREADAFGALAVDSYLLIVDAIQRAGSADPVKIKEALQTADLEVVTGRTIMTPEGNPVKDFFFLKVENGQFVYATMIPASRAAEIKALMGK